MSSTLGYISLWLERVDVLQTDGSTKREKRTRCLRVAAAANQELRFDYDDLHYAVSANPWCNAESFFSEHKLRELSKAANDLRFKQEDVVFDASTTSCNILCALLVVLCRASTRRTNLDNEGPRLAELIDRLWDATSNADVEVSTISNANIKVQRTDANSFVELDQFGDAVQRMYDSRGLRHSANTLPITETEIFTHSINT